MVVTIILITALVILLIQKKSAAKKAAQAAAAKKAAEKAAKKAAKEKVKKLKTYLGRLSYQFLNEWMVGEDALRATVEKGLNENRLGFYLIMRRRFEDLGKSDLGEVQKAKKGLFDSLVEGELTLKKPYQESWKSIKNRKIFLTELMGE